LRRPRRARRAQRDDPHARATARALRLGLRRDLGLHHARGRRAPPSPRVDPPSARALLASRAASVRGGAHPERLSPPRRRALPRARNARRLPRARRRPPPPAPSTAWLLAHRPDHAPLLAAPRKPLAE